jgi:hypothetical protein
MLYISGLGYYEAEINGVNISSSVLDPPLTHFAARVSYAAVDVTALLKVFVCNVCPMRSHWVLEAWRNEWHWSHAGQWLVQPAAAPHVCHHIPWPLSNVMFSGGAASISATLSRSAIRNSFWRCICSTMPSLDLLQVTAGPC